MKPDAMLINTARGPHVDEKALVRHLQSNPSFSAGLDVYEDEPLMAPGLAECENAVLLPHIASATLWTRSGMVCADEGGGLICGRGRGVISVDSMGMKLGCSIMTQYRLWLCKTVPGPFTLPFMLLPHPPSPTGKAGCLQRGRHSERVPRLDTARRRPPFRRGGSQRHATNYPQRPQRL